MFFVKKMFNIFIFGICDAWFDMYNVFMYVFVCVFRVKSKDSHGCLSLPSTLFEKGSLETQCVLGYLATSFQEFCCLTTSTGIAQECYCVQFYMHSRDSNSGSHVCHGKHFTISPS